MDFQNLILGFLLGTSLIVAIGPQNVFVIEQGLKKQFTFLVCLICSICDVALISVGLYLFSYFDSYLSPQIELILNLFLIIFLAHFIWSKIRETYNGVSFNLTKKGDEKLIFGHGASMSSITFFFTTGYLSRSFSEYLSNEIIMKKIDLIIISIMSFLVLGILYKAIIN